MARESGPYQQIEPRPGRVAGLGVLHRVHNVRLDEAMLQCTRLLVVVGRHDHHAGVIQVRVPQLRHAARDICPTFKYPGTRKI